MMTAIDEAFDAADRLLALLVGTEADDTVEVPVRDLRTILDATSHFVPDIADDELEVIVWLWNVVSRRDPDEVRRVLTYITDRFEAADAEVNPR